MDAKLYTGKSVGMIVLVLRRFLRSYQYKVEIENPNKKKKIKIPMKELYHFAFSNKGISVFTEEEAFDMQNTHHITKEKLEPEKGVIHMSSERLLRELLYKKYDIDIILDKIDKYGRENLRKDEKEYLANMAS